MKSAPRLRSTRRKAGPASWTLDAAQLPIAFAQVREDAELDQWVAERLPANAEVLMVSSGGCTAAVLAAMPQVRRLHLVDPNPTQIALARLKLRLLATTGITERFSILGHAPMSTRARRSRLRRELGALNLPTDALGPIDKVAKTGPDHAGRYEFLFSKFREALIPAEDELAALLQLSDPAEQTRLAAPATTFGRTLDAAFDAVMALPNLVALFGEGATRNRVEPFSRHFARRTRQVLTTLPAANNPYLWQILRGHFPESTAYPWLSLASPARLAEVSWTVTSMANALQNCSEAYDFIHLSNILDWLTPAEARATLELAWKALRPRGWTLIRQLNSSLEIQSLGGRFAWQGESARRLHGRDRSFFYRGLHLGRKS